MSVPEPDCILIQGNWKTHKRITTYEKTTDDYEKVAGRGASKGTAAHQAKLFVSTAVPIGVFDKQMGYEGKSSATASAYDDNWCVDGGKCRVKIPDNGALMKGCLKDGQTIAEDALLMFEAATGKIIALATTGSYKIGIAEVASSPSGDDDEEFLYRWVTPELLEA